MLQRGSLAKAILLAAALQGAALRVVAQTRSDTSSLFPAKPTGYVTDAAGVLDAGSVQKITDIAERLRGATGAEIATVVLPTIGDRAAVDVAVAIGRAWGVGAKAAIGDQRRNAGLIVLLVPRREGDVNSGQIFIASGNGLEGIVTDLQAGRVRDLMRPYFQRNAYGEGLEAGVRALAGLIARGMGVTDSALTAGGRGLEQAPPNQERGGGLLSALFVMLMIIILLSRLARAARRGGRGGRGGGGPGPWIFWGGGGGGGGGFGGGGGGFGGFGGGGGFSGGGAGGRF